MSTINRYITQSMPHSEFKADASMKIKAMPIEKEFGAAVEHEPVLCRKIPDKARRAEKAAKRFQQYQKKKAFKKAGADAKAEIGEAEQVFEFDATMEANSIEADTILEEHSNETHNEQLWERSRLLVRAIFQSHQTSEGFDMIMRFIGADRSQRERIVGAQSFEHMASILVAENLVPSAGNMPDYLQPEPAPMPIQGARRYSFSPASWWSYAFHYSNTTQRECLLDLLEAPERMREAIHASYELGVTRDIIDYSQIFVRREDEYWIGELLRAQTPERRRQLLDERGAPAAICDAVLDTVDARRITAIVTLNGLTKLGGENPTDDLLALAQEALESTEESCLSHKLPSLSTPSNNQPHPYIWLEVLLNATTRYEMHYILKHLGASHTIREAILHSDRQQIEMIAIGSGLIAPNVEVSPEPIAETLMDSEGAHNIWVETFMAGSENMRRDMLLSMCTSDSTVEEELAISDRDLVEAISAGYGLFTNPDALECKPKGLGAKQTYSDVDDSEGPSTNGHVTPATHSGCSSPATTSSLSSLTSLEDEDFGLAPFFMDEEPFDCLNASNSSTYDTKSDYDEWEIRLIEEYEGLEMVLGLDKEGVMRQDEELEPFSGSLNTPKHAPTPFQQRRVDIRRNEDDFDISTLPWLLMARLSQLPDPIPGEDALLA